MKKLTPTHEHRLETERNIWVATTRPDGRPHLAPVWFVWHDNAIWFCSQAKSVRARNLGGNHAIAFSLEDGDKPLIGEGRATHVPKTVSPIVIQQFQAKYDWNIIEDIEYDALFRVAIQKWMHW
jgi:hypothetical protein